MHNLFVTTALTVCLAVPATSGNWAVAVPEALPEGGGDVKDEGWQFFLREMGPGDALTVLNATKPGLVASIKVPDDPKYERPKWRARTFARENAQIAAYLDQIADGAPITDVLGVLRYTALNRIDPDVPLDLMIVGTAVQVFEETPSLSMRQEDVLLVPSQDHLSAQVSDTAYGMGAESPTGLRNVYVHMCPVADDLRPDEEGALQAFYADYIEAREGQLVTWSSDLPTCFKRFGAEVRTLIDVAPFAEATGELVMLRVGEAVPEIVVETEPTTVIMEGIEVDQFNLFSGAAHPSLSGVEVTTGIVYTPEKFPDVYEKAYCYFNVSASGSSLRFDLGEKRPGGSPTWERASVASLKAGGISRAVFEAGRNACQWPTD